GFLLLLVLPDIHHHHLGFTVLGDDDRLRIGSELLDHIRRVRLQVGDRLDLFGEGHGMTPSSQSSDRIQAEFSPAKPTHSCIASGHAPCHASPIAKETPMTSTADAETFKALAGVTTATL